MSENNMNQSPLQETYTQSSPFNAQQTISAEKQQALATYTKIIYGLYIASVFLGITVIIGIIMAYAKRDDATGTVYRSHLDSLVKIFWVSLGLYVVGFITSFFMIGFVILFATAIWFLYKTVTGLIRCIDGKPLSP